MNARSVSIPALLNIAALAVTLYPARGADVTKIYVLSSINGSRVTTYTPDGHRIDPSIELGHCNCGNLAVDAAGKIYVTNNWSHDNLMTFGPDGRRTDPTLNSSVYAVKAGGDGLLYALTPGRGANIVRTFNAAGKPMSLLGEAGIKPLNGLAVDPAGKIYLISRGVSVIRLFDAGGNPVTPPMGGLNSPSAVAVGPDGKVYIAMFFSVATFLPNGKRVLPTLTSVNVEDGFATPSALAVDAKGNIYVGYYTIGGGHGRVAVYTSAGKQIIAFSTPNGVAGIALR